MNLTNCNSNFAALFEMTLVKMVASNLELPQKIYVNFEGL
jgi:hypothetical protein